MKFRPAEVYLGEWNGTHIGAAMADAFTEWARESNSDAPVTSRDLDVAWAAFYDAFTQESETPLEALAKACGSGMAVAFSDGLGKISLDYFLTPVIATCRVELLKLHNGRCSHPNPDATRRGKVVWDDLSGVRMMMIGGQLVSFYEEAPGVVMADVVNHPDFALLKFDVIEGRFTIEESLGPVGAYLSEELAVVDGARSGLHDALLALVLQITEAELAEKRRMLIAAKSALDAYRSQVDDDADLEGRYEARAVVGAGVSEVVVYDLVEGRAVWPESIAEMVNNPAPRKVVPIRGDGQPRSAPHVG